MLIPGTIVQCIKGDNKYPITIGKQYEVLKEDHKGTFDGIKIVNDNNKTAKYKTKYFKVISEPKLEDYLNSTMF